VQSEEFWRWTPRTQEPGSLFHCAVTSMSPPSSEFSRLCQQIDVRLGSLAVLVGRFLGLWDTPHSGIVIPLHSRPFDESVAASIQFVRGYFGVEGVVSIELKEIFCAHYHSFFENNREMGRRDHTTAAGFFETLAASKIPKFVWIGCRTAACRPMRSSGSYRANYLCIATSPMSSCTPT